MGLRADRGFPLLQTSEEAATSSFPEARRPRATKTIFPRKPGALPEKKSKQKQTSRAWPSCRPPANTPCGVGPAPQLNVLQSSARAGGDVLHGPGPHMAYAVLADQRGAPTRCHASPGFSFGLAAVPAGFGSENWKFTGKISGGIYRGV